MIAVRASRRRESGMTLIEILIGIVLASFVVLVAGSGFVFVTRGWYGQQARLETQQNLRVAVERLVRELRLAGACLPQWGEVPDLALISGRDGGERDVLEFRTNRTCARSALRAAYPGGGGPIQLHTVEGFAVGMQAYIWNPNTRTGEFFRVAEVNVPGRWISPATGLSGSYPGSQPPLLDASVLGVETQRYEVVDDRGVPELHLTVNRETGGRPEPLARGIERLNVRYVLQRAYRVEDCVAAYSREDPANPLCVKEEPLDTEWPLVRAVLLEVWARSLRPVPGVGGDGFYRLRQGDFGAVPLVVRPRNVLHHGD